MRSREVLRHRRMETWELNHWAKRSPDPVACVGYLLEEQERLECLRSIRSASPFELAYAAHTIAECHPEESSSTSQEANDRRRAYIKRYGSGTYPSTTSSKETDESSSSLTHEQPSPRTPRAITKIRSG
jgi:hypothetical protein